MRPSFKINLISDQTLPLTPPDYYLFTGCGLPSKITITDLPGMQGWYGASVQYCFWSSKTISELKSDEGFDYLNGEGGMGHKNSDIIF